MQARRIPLTAAVLLATACAPLHRSAAGSPVLVERLYFGRSAGDSFFVSDSAWTLFLSEVITPRFPSGLTSWRAEGQWRRPDGVLERESTFVLEAVHPARPDLERALTEIVTEYKRRFHQQSVLRVQTSARADF